MVEEKTNVKGTKSEETQSQEDPIKAVEERLAQMETRLNQQQSVITKKDVENKKLREQLEDRSEETALSKAMIAAISQRTGQSEETVEETVREKQPDLLKQYDEILETSKRKRQAEEGSRQLRELQREVTSLGYSEKDTEYWEIFGRAAGGNYDSAFQRVEQLKAVKTPEKKEKTEEEKQREIEEAARQYLEKQGLLKTETGFPSGAVGGKVYTRSEIASMSAQEYRKVFPKIEDFYKAVQDGKIKE